MINFLQNLPVQHVAVYTVLIIVFALALKPGKSKAKFVSPEHWVPSEYFMYLKALICTAPTMDKLDEVRPQVEKFFDKHFNSTANNKELQKYYARLMRAISDKEKQLVRAMLQAV